MAFQTFISVLPNSMSLSCYCASNAVVISIFLRNYSFAIKVVKKFKNVAVLCTMNDDDQPNRLAIDNAADFV
jgi:hypothetical protein